MSSTSISKLNKQTSSTKKNNDNDNDKQIFENTVNAFFANDLDRKNAEEYIFKLFDDMIDWIIKKQFIVSIFIIERNFFRCCMLTKNWFDEYISFRSWNLTRIKK
jgi:hypothetical protein